MQSFPEPARLLVDRMSAAAAADPARAVAFQGAPGANSHRAAIEAMPDGLPLPCFSFEDALDAVKDGRAGQAIIPIENSQHGRVADIHFLLPESGLSIVGEHFLDIHHCLMARADAGTIRAAYSHPQALGQSRFYLRERGIVPMAYADTAGAAALVAESQEAGIAAIAPRIAAELYGLDLLAENIEDAHDNTTRFVLLSKTARDPATLTGAAMTTFVFEVRNIPAALYKALGGFATNGVNMTKLESYQKGASFAATMFFADIVGAPGDPAVDRALEELAYFAKDLRILGSYPLERARG
ncbi:MULTISPECIES: prephenate dehydratase [unclassified Novosphingobium]|uniref:prephenate dehydratase n=1 Tax=Novosphingobium TaxID=165696 RepID=UPI00146ABAB2|nr:MULTISPECIES: prephenate dehydratase [unclassified Novosphingobium]NMN05490.1 prephenate dehydratase [Novosphingobium sp. SG919]NMN88151.1 prephenate dehydratase [Novosphingobium sp. SG916]